MGAPVAAIATSVLAPQIGQLVTGIAEEVGKKALGGANPLSFLGGIDAFAHLFGQRTQFQQGFPQFAMPFSQTGGLPFDNPFSPLQNSFGAFQDALPILGGALNLFGGGSPSAGFGVGSSSTGGGSLSSSAIAATEGGDELMKQAVNVLNDPNSTSKQKLEAQETIARVKDAIQLASAMISIESSIRQAITQSLKS